MGTRAQPHGYCRGPHWSGGTVTMGREVRFLPPRLRHRRRRQVFCKDNPGHSKGKEVSMAKTRPFPQRWITGLATYHVFATRRKCTPCRCDCYLSLLPPYSFPSLSHCPSLFRNRIRSSQGESAPVGCGPKSVTPRAHRFAKPVLRYPKAVTSSFTSAQLFGPSPQHLSLSPP